MEPNHSEETILILEDSVIINGLDDIITIIYNSHFPRYPQTQTEPNRIKSNQYFLYSALTTFMLGYLLRLFLFDFFLRIVVLSSGYLFFYHPPFLTVSLGIPGFFVLFCTRLAKIALPFNLV